MKVVLSNLVLYLVSIKMLLYIDLDI